MALPELVSAQLAFGRMQMVHVQSRARGDECGDVLWVSLKWEIGLPPIFVWGL